MSSDLQTDIRLHRVAILGEWREGFLRRLEDSCLGDPDLPGDLLPSLFNEMLELLEGDNSRRIPWRHQTGAIGGMAGFPANISICLKLLKAGEEAIRDFLVDVSPVFARLSEGDRECRLEDLNRATQNLIHREIRAICEQSLRPMAEVFERIRGHRGSSGPQLIQTGHHFL